MKNNKYRVALLILAIAITFTSVSGLSFAYYAEQIINNDTVNMNVASSDVPTFEYYVESNPKMTINEELMSYENSTEDGSLAGTTYVGGLCEKLLKLNIDWEKEEPPNEYEECVVSDDNNNNNNSGGIGTTLTNPENDNKNYTATYDIYLNWEQNGYVSHTSGIEGNEFTVILYSNDTCYNGNNYYILRETDLSTLPKDEKGILLGSDMITTDGNSASREISIDFNFYNYSNADQSDFVGKSHVGKISIENVIIREATAAEVLSEIEEDDPSGMRISEDGLNYDINYRFIGSDPDNYICLDEECDENNLYRIVGTFNEKYLDENENESTARMIKVISSLSEDLKTRDELDNYLNVNYYNSLSFKNKIAKTAWYKGNCSRNNDSNNYYNCERQTYIYNYIGLLYASDLSALDIRYDSNNFYLHREYPNDSSWLFNYHRQFGIGFKYDFGSNKIDEEMRDTSFKYYASFYLKPDVKFASGDGTKTNPYKLR